MENQNPGPMATPSVIISIGRYSIYIYMCWYWTILDILYRFSICGVRSLAGRFDFGLRRRERGCLCDSVTNEACDMPVLALSCVNPPGVLFVSSLLPGPPWPFLQNRWSDRDPVELQVFQDRRPGSTSEAAKLSVLRHCTKLSLVVLVQQLLSGSFGYGVMNK